MRTQLLLVFWTSLYCQVDAVFRRTTGEGSKVMEGEKESGGQALRRSKRGWMWNHFFLMEEYTGEDRQYVGKLQSDLDKGDGSVKYVLSGEGAGSIFVIDENSGDLHATKRLDREEKAFYRLHIKAVNKITNRPLEPETDFIVKIHDINDNEPKFSKELYEASVHEMSDIGTSVIQVTATDADDSTYGNSARLTYSILHGQPYFSVEPETGIIRTALPSMDREKREHYQVVIQAKDMAGQNGGLSGTATVNISLLDVNDNPPQFPQRIYQFSIPESSEPGALVGRIKAIDADVGRNAEMKYSIVAGDGLDVFEMVTDQNTQEGIVTGRKALDYEKKKTYTLAVKVEDAHPDPRFLSATSFKDAATVRVVVEDVDEPPVFERPSYIMEVKEESAAGTAVGSVSAADPDQRHSPVRYSIDRLTDLDMNFNIHPGNGSIFAVRPLDREAAAWHNITVIAVESDNLRQMSRVPVHIRVLDINDNAPTFATFYEAFVCENAKAGQRIQTVSATDSDDPAGGHRFSFRLAPEGLTKGNFTIRDNGDNTAGIILTRSSGFSRQQKSSYLVPVVISDGDYPVQSSTSTLTVRVCACGRDGSMELCNAEALTHPAGLSTGALVAILLCIVILLMIVVLFAALRRQKKKEPLIISKEDVRDNIISYNDEGGGEEDTQAFDIGALRHPETVEENAKRRDILPEALGPPPRQSAALFRDNADVRHFINQRVQESDQNPAAPPYDSLATYAYEGTGSVAESLSSLGSASSDQDQDYNYLSEWGPRFRKLADMYGDEDRYS